MSLQRRPLAKAKTKIAHLSAGYGGIIVDDERIDYTPLCDEHWQALLKYMPEDIATLREFLLDGSHDWDNERDAPIYEVGWPGGPKLTVTGAKAATETLRRWYPFRDHAPDMAANVEPAPAESAQRASTVVPLRLSGPAQFREWVQVHRT